MFPYTSVLTNMDLSEKIKRPVVEGVRLTLPTGETSDGVLCITAFYFIFSTRKKGEEETMFLHTSILSVGRQNPSSLTVNVFLKDFRKFTLDFQSVEESTDTVESLEALSSPGRLDQLHAFFAHPKATDAPPFCPEKLEAVLSRYQCSPDCWRVSSCNKGYKLCSSHPQEVIVPTKITDEAIAVVATFRQHGRFPILCFHHNKNKAVLLRCGEPLCGTSQKRCKEDISFLNSCLKLNKGRILDIRTQQAAQYQASKGGGVEFPSNYSQWRVEYASLESIPNIQASFTKLIEACNDPSLLTSSSWFGRLEASGWLTHVEQILRATKHIVHTIHLEGSSVVVHGTTGRDGTLQVTSLAILLMDPHARTVTGFINLIEREWLQGGHPFSLRHGHTSAVPDKQRGPIFLLFLDSLWQIMRQYPLSFEFNERLLHLLFVHSYSSNYGTFLYDMPAERDKVKLSEKTESLWNYILSPLILPSLLNPLYKQNNVTLIISTHPCGIEFWRRLYMRTDLNPMLHLPGQEALTKIKERNSQLKVKLKEIRKGLDTLQIEGRQYSSVWL